MSQAGVTDLPGPFRKFLDADAANHTNIARACTLGSELLLLIQRESTDCTGEVYPCVHQLAEHGTGWATS